MYNNSLLKKKKNIFLNKQIPMPKCDFNKVAKLKLQFKKKSKSDPLNYRPISLLLLLSEIFEGIFLDKTNGF